MLNVNGKGLQEITVSLDGQRYVSFTVDFDNGEVTQSSEYNESIVADNSEPGGEEGPWGPGGPEAPIAPGDPGTEGPGESAGNAGPGDAPSYDDGPGWD